jgi:hypothetical protein
MPNPINIFRKGDARRLQVAEKAKNPKKNLSYKNALSSVDTLGESKGGRRKLRGLRRTGQLVDIKDARKEDRANRKKKRMQKRYGEMKFGGSNQADAKNVLKYFGDIDKARKGVYMDTYNDYFRKGGCKEVFKSSGPRTTYNPLDGGNGLNIRGKGKVKKAFRRAGEKIARGFRRIF